MVCINISQLDICSISSLGMIETYHRLRWPLDWKAPWCHHEFMKNFTGDTKRGLLLVFLADETENLFQVGVQPKQPFTQFACRISSNFLGWIKGRCISFICGIGFRFESFFFTKVCRQATWLGFLTENFQVQGPWWLHWSDILKVHHRFW